MKFNEQYVAWYWLLKMISRKAKKDKIQDSSYLERISLPYGWRPNRSKIRNPSHQMETKEANFTKLIGRKLEMIRPGNAKVRTPSHPLPQVITVTGDANDLIRTRLDWDQILESYRPIWGKLKFGTTHRLDP